jgi:hypothetical protein
MILEHFKYIETGRFVLEFGLNLAIENLNKHMILAHFKYIES